MQLPISPHTRPKQSVIAGVMAANLDWFKGHGVGRFAYFDMNAHTGFGSDRGGTFDGSSLIFIKAAEAAGVTAFSTLFENSRSVYDQLKVNVLAHQSPKHLIAPIFGNSADLIGAVVRAADGTYGLIYCDPCGTGIPFDKLKEVVPTNVDLLMNVNARSFARRSGVDGIASAFTPQFRELQRSKRIWWISEPDTSAANEWAILFGTDVRKYSAFEQLWKLGFRELDTDDGKAFFARSFLPKTPLVPRAVKPVPAVRAGPPAVGASERKEPPAHSTKLSLDRLTKIRCGVALDPELRKTIVRELATGSCRQDIARKLGMRTDWRIRCVYEAEHATPEELAEVAESVALLRMGEPATAAGLKRATACVKSMLDETRLAIEHLLQEGKSRAQVQEITGSSQWVVANVATLYFERMRNRMSAVTPEQPSRVAGGKRARSSAVSTASTDTVDVGKFDELLQRGCSISELMKAFSLSTHKIRDIMRRNGLESVTARHNRNARKNAGAIAAALLDQLPEVLAEKFDTSVGAIRRVCDLGALASKRRQKYVAARLVKMTSLYDAGQTLDQIAAVLKIPAKSVRACLRRSGKQLPGSKSTGARPRPASSKVDIDELKRLIAQGRTGPELAAMMGVQQPIIRRLAQQHGLDLQRARATPLTASQHAEIQAVLTAGTKSVTEVAKEFNISTASIWRKFDTSGIAQKRKDELRAAARRLTAEGHLTPAEIAKQLGVSRSSVYRYQLEG